MDALRQRLGRAVRRLRLAAGYSQEAFADHVGVHRTYMGAVERGRVNISLDNIERLAGKLGLTAAGLLSEAESETQDEAAADPNRSRAADSGGAREG